MTDTDSQLQRALEEKRGSYEVRTRHLDEQGAPRYINRLILEDSPYLLQHAHNPVNWYAWGDEAFETAAAEDKPVFLSIGYSTCHWCHVMEEESFDDEQVAAFLNANFISIKVDREQRPDIDEIYMTAVQLLTQRGGWPMSSFLDTGGNPFFGGTYYPKDQFLHLLNNVVQGWRSDRQSILAGGQRLREAMEQQLVTHQAAERAGAQQLEHVARALRAMEDPHCGGFGEAPKFPNESSLLFLLDRLARSREPLAKQPGWHQVQRSLYAMLQGGIYDQIGGGFHRYATDRNWLIPHFEKMLYNQAQLIRVYLRAWELCGFVEYERIVEECIGYLLREMQSPDGAFFSATDADSEGEEGRFFAWPWEELKRELEPAELELVQAVYGASENGNFEGANILHLAAPLADTARALGTDRDSLLARLQPLREKLYRLRKERIVPLRDDKLITEWNAMLITALAEAGRVMQRESWLRAALDAAKFIDQHSRDRQGRLLRCNLNGRASVDATLEDYAQWLEACLALYDATAESAWLERALEAEQQMLELFANDATGGFYNSRADSNGPLIVRSQSAHDGATAAGNSVALVASVALNQRHYDSERRARIEHHWLRFSDLVDKIPAGLCYLLTGVAEQLQAAPRSLQYAGEGRLRIDAQVQREGEAGYLVSVELHTRAGWHPGGKGIDIPTPKLTAAGEQAGWDVDIQPGPARLDAPSSAAVAFAGESLCFEGRARAVGDELRGPIALSLSLQLCSEDHCLAPEQIVILLHPH